MLLFCAVFSEAFANSNAIGQAFTLLLTPLPSHFRRIKTETIGDIYHGPAVKRASPLGDVERWRCTRYVPYLSCASPSIRKECRRVDIINHFRFHLPLHRHRILRSQKINHRHQHRQRQAIPHWRHYKATLITPEIRAPKLHRRSRSSKRQ
jgi:hypothetical protein